MQNLSKKWKALWNHDMYHGWGQTKNYFEGWYFKIIDPSEKYKLAIIPGISMDKMAKQHSFIQVLDSSKQVSNYYSFPAIDFKPSPTVFDLSLSTHSFSNDHIELNFPNLNGKLQFHELITWPSNWKAPGIMGWYSFVPFMECYHGLISMNHRISGCLEVDGILVDFNGGKGYIEKDWGSSFPSQYIWMQSNHFSHTQEASLFASVAKIPWLGSSFIGFIAGFWLNGQLYPFTTYGGDKFKLYVDAKKVHLSYINPKYQLHIVADRHEGTQLQAPVNGEMTGKVNESLHATVLVELIENGITVYKGEGRNAGLEVTEEIKDLISG